MNIIFKRNIKPVSLLQHFIDISKYSEKLKDEVMETLKNVELFSLVENI